MSLSKQDIARRLSHFHAVAKAAGIKLTHQRLEIFREIASSIEHPSAEILFNALKLRLPTLSLDTVYRSLWLLNDLGLIMTLGARRESLRFDANLEHHHHFVCTRCGRIRDFTSPQLTDLPIPDAVKELGHIDSTHVEVRGICTTCSKDPVEDSAPRNPKQPKGEKRSRS